MIVVCSLAAIPTQIERHRVDRMVSLLGPESMIPTPPAIAPENHLRLTLHDICSPIEGHILPCEDHVGELIEFVSGWRCDKPMLIHCYAGISRSTAAAFTTMCIHEPDTDEVELARRLRKASATATPNALIVEMADRLLGRGGRMVEAVRAIGTGQPAWECVPFSLDVRPPQGAGTAGVAAG